MLLSKSNLECSVSKSPKTKRLEPPKKKRLVLLLNKDESLKNKSNPETFCGSKHSSSSNSSNMNDDVNAVKVNSNSNGNDDNDANLNNELSSMNIDSSHRSSDRNCLYCLQVVQGSSRCSKCRTALYCNRGCQEKHWPVHKNICIDSNNAEDSDEKLSIKAKNHYNQGK